MNRVRLSGGDLYKKNDFLVYVDPDVYTKRRFSIHVLRSRRAM